MKALDGTPCAASAHRSASGGVVRLTSACSRQRYGVPSWATWVRWARRDCDRPSTRSPPTVPQVPYRLSNEWFSS